MFGKNGGQNGQNNSQPRGKYFDIQTTPGHYDNNSEKWDSRKANY